MRTRIRVAAAVSVTVIIAALLLSACGPKEQYSEASWEPTETTGAAAPAVAAPEKLFEIGNIYGVREGAKAPTFTLAKDATITGIADYHYVIGGGPTPGTIALKAADGTIYGPWDTVGLEGQGGVANATWDAKPNAKVPAGTYTVVDSDPSTWSTNDAAEGLGFVTVFGTYAE